MYEGTPDTPHQGRFWEIVEKHGDHHPVHRAHRDPHVHEVGRATSRPGFDLSSLRLLGSVGEPINPEAWMWYRRVIGGDRCPIVDTWWQTETGAIMISPLPGVTSTKPGSATRPLPGIGADVVNDTGEPVPNGSGGYLVLTEPWPSMLRGIWGDPAALQAHVLVAVRPACTSPATARRRTRTATCGCSVASTTS